MLAWFSRIAPRAWIVTIATLIAMLVQYAALSYALHRVTAIEESGQRNREATEAIDALADSLGKIGNLLVGTAGGIYAAPGVAWKLPRFSETIDESWRRVTDRLAGGPELLGSGAAMEALARLPAFLARAHDVFTALPPYASPAERRLLEDLHDDWLDLNKPLQQFVDAVRAGIDAQGRRNLDDARAMDRTLSLFAGVALALGVATLLLGWYIFIHGIAHPTARLVTALRRIARGQTDFAVPDTSRGGEIGDMARAVEQFRDSTIENRRLQQAAQENLVREAAERRRVEGLERDRELRRREIAESRHRLEEETRRAEELRIARDEADRANRAKSQFLANMSHELRTPLNAIIGFSDVIRSRHFGANAIDRYVAYAGSIHESGQHLLSMINDLIDLSKIEAGKFELDDAVIDPNDLLESCRALMRGQAAERGLKLHCGASDRHVRLRADERAVRQVLLNLLSNAVKFTPENGQVTVSAGLQPDHRFAVVVSDTGVGIAAKDIARIFEPFERGDAWHVRRAEGAGLGLTISRNLMALHDGTLTLESDPGIGTTATMTFPSHRVLAPAAPATEPAERIAGAN